MLNSKKTHKSKFQNNGHRKLIILSAAAATLVASGDVVTKPVATGLSIGTATQGAQLTADITSINGTEYHYKWLSGDVIVGTDSLNYTPSNDDVGNSISVEVSYKNAVGSNAVTKSNIVAKVGNVNDAPTGDVDIGLVAIVGNELTANTNNLVDVDGLGTLHFQWKVGGVNAGTDAATYTPNTADIGKSVTVEISYTDVYGANETFASNEVAEITKTPDVTPSATDGPIQKFGGEFLVNSAHANNQLEPSVAMLKGGGFVILWQSTDATSADTEGPAIKAQIYDAAGNKVGGEILVNDQYVSSQNFAAVTALDNGGFAATWQSLDSSGADTDGTAIKAKLFDSTGVAVAPEFLVNSATNGYQLSPEIASTSGGGFLIGWESFDQTSADTTGSAIKAQFFDENAAKVGSEFLVNSTFANTQGEMSIAHLNNDDIVVVWTSTSEETGGNGGFSIRARLYDTTGTAIADDFVVNTVAPGVQRNPTVAALSQGGFAVTWDSTDQQGDDKHGIAIKAQIVGNTGNKIGPEILVNSEYGAGSLTDFEDGYGQRDPSIVATENGGFAVTWQSSDEQSADNEVFAIKAQVYSGNGTPLNNGDYLVNSQIQNSQTASDIAYLENGKHVVTWQSNDQQSADDSFAAIKAQILEIDIPALPKMVTARVEYFDAVNIQNNIVIETIDILPDIQIEPDFGGADLLPDHYDYS